MVAEYLGNGVVDVMVKEGGSWRAGVEVCLNMPRKAVKAAESGANRSRLCSMDNMVPWACGEGGGGEDAGGEGSGCSRNGVWREVGNGETSGYATR